MAGTRGRTGGVQPGGDCGLSVPRHRRHANGGTFASDDVPTSVCEKPPKYPQRTKAYILTDMAIQRLIKIGTWPRASCVGHYRM